LDNDASAQARIDDAVSESIALHSHRPGGLLPLLHEVQDRLGYVPPRVLPVIARAMNLSAAEVHGVVTFYHHFRAAPPGRHVLRMCRAEACQSMGAERLAGHARTELGIDWHETSADGAWTLEPAYCLGNCACAPAVMIDSELHGRVDSQRLQALLRSTPPPASNGGGAQ
jgi:formate dehydrogenase subunit gamma